MANATQIVIGLDGGGTHTRAVAVDLNGQVRARVRTGGASPHKNADAEANVKRAITQAIAQAGCTAAQVVQIVAGIAGLDKPSDQEWAMRFTQVPGVTCPRQVVNDAVVAHAGAHEGKPGIIAIAGTGSLVFGATETGRHVRNYDFHHYTPVAARHLAFDVVYRLLAGEATAEDEPLSESILAFCQKATLPALREWALAGFHADPMERTRFFGDMAPLVTQAAAQNIPLAMQACDAAADNFARGIRLVAACFGGADVPVALIGGVAQSAYFKKATRRLLAAREPRCVVTEPAFCAEAGTALLALTACQRAHDPAVRSRLRASLGEEP